MKKPWLIVFLSLAVIGFTVFFSASIVKSLNEYRIQKEAIAELLNFKERVMSTAEWMPFNDVADSKAQEFEVLLETAQLAYSQALNHSFILIGGLLVYILLIAVGYWHTVYRFRTIGMAFIVTSLCLVFLGLQTPFLEIEAYNADLAFQVPIDVGFFEHTFEKTFEGKISYFYQNKSVFQIITLLFTGGNAIVGLALVLFSVVFPLFKLFTSLLLLIFPLQPSAKTLTKVIVAIGKWSMADVFVAGVFLAYFSFANMNVGVETSAKTLLGLYFFLGFVVLSILSSYFVKKAVESASSESNHLAL